jgi:hypothetical protein
MRVDDLLIGVLIIGLLSAMLFIVSLRLSRALGDRLNNLLAIMIVTLIVGFVVHVQGRIALARVLPFSNLIVVSNWQPLLVSALAGLIWRRLPRQFWRRSIVTVALVGACLTSVYSPILAAPPTLQDRWDGDVCLQTSQASCTPAAAATLLSAHGIQATEQELALLCFTSNQGTNMLGLYRGLKLKTAGTAWDVYMFDHATIDDLRGAGPAILSVELRDQRLERHVQTWGWIPGVPHSVVFLGFIDETKVMIGDPSTGREVWTLDDLRLLWHGQGARLVRGR